LLCYNNVAAAEGCVAAMTFCGKEAISGAPPGRDAACGSGYRVI
jgi:hypothetical protein